MPKIVKPGRLKLEIQRHVLPIEKCFDEYYEFISKQMAVI